MNFRKLLAGMLAFAWLGTANATPVSLELALLVDVSGSVNDTEYNLQKQGYVNAFKDPSLQAAIASLTNGIAVTYIEWSHASQQSQLVGWTHLFDSTTADAFADAIANTTRAFSSLTAPGSAINYAVPLFNDNGFEGSRLVIDVSGDGQENNGDNTSDARDAALAAGIDAINGLPIGGPGLANWYNDNIKGGTDSFVILANDFQSFNAAVAQKIRKEIQPVPAPAPLAMLALGLIGMASTRRFKARASA